MFNLEERSSLLSLLELLNLSEYFVTVDHSVQWQRHISWSKPLGEHLRKYVTERYASNMVFLSCMLAAQINVFFNSSKELTDMRSLLGVQSHSRLRYWIGVTILMDISTTIIALVTTFTLWGMVSSISDANTHALLRSSIGQYVTSLPSKFSVAALYLFLLWIILFVADLVKGPVQIGLLLMIFFMFFQVVIPLSAFGRLIIHTGAMATRPVLDKDLEKELLPSGLHASLLIRATDRRRKYSNATDQYAKQNKKSRRGDGINSLGASGAASASLPSHPSVQHPPENISFNVPRSDSDDLTLDGSAASMNYSEEIGENSQARPVSGHRRMETLDTVGSDNFFFPGAQILNATLAQGDIHDVVQRSVRLSQMGGDLTVPAETTKHLEDGLSPESAPAPPDSQPPLYGGTPPVDFNSREDRRTRHGSGHRRIGSGTPLGVPRDKLGNSKPTTPAMTPTEGDGQHNKGTIMSGIVRDDYSSPTLIVGRKTYSNTSPVIRKDNSISPVIRRETFNAHPLLTSPVAQVPRPPVHGGRPPKRSSLTRRAGSHSRSGSFLGLFPLQSAFDELEEENEIRELFDAPPAVHTEERLSREFNSTLFSPNNSRSRSAPQQQKAIPKHKRTNSVTPIQEETTPKDVEGGGGQRRRTASEPLVEPPEESTHLLADFASDNRLNHYG